MNHTPQQNCIDGSSLVMSYPINQHNLGVCTKYNNCMQPKGATKTQYFNHQGLDEDSSFSFPDVLMSEESPLQIEVEPNIVYENDGLMIDRMVQNNLNQRKIEKLRQKHEQEKLQHQRKQKLKQLKQECSNIVTKCPKKPFSLEKKDQWNHSIFGQKKQSDDNNIKRQAHPQKESPKKEKKVELKKVQQRIEEYKQNCKHKLNEQRKAQECKHNHTHSHKNLEEKKAQIDKRAQQITKKIKEEKIQRQEDKKTMKAKIRAIEIESRESLKKFKKKPVDSTIQFIVDVPANEEKKKARKDKKESNAGKLEQLAKQQEQARIASYQRSKKANIKQKSKHSKQASKRKDSQTSSELKENSVEQQQQQPENPQSGKFYFWDMPIYKDDCKKIALDMDKFEGGWRTEPIRQKKSFRTEVQQYLEQKNREKMHEENRFAKAKKLDELVREKKQFFLQQFEQTQSLKDSSSQVFWNEDQIFKFQPISNFKN